MRMTGGPRSAPAARNESQAAAARQTAARTRRRCTHHSFAPLKTSLRSNDSGSWSVKVVSAFPKHRLLFADKPWSNRRFGPQRINSDPFWVWAEKFWKKSPNMHRLWHINLIALRAPPGSWGIVLSWEALKWKSGEGGDFNFSGWFPLPLGGIARGRGVVAGQ